ncbi:MAG: hypothetical protein IT449_13585 [Phycisphaerales bacterium]|nr:hypothetical protein [Phycisphaerales bacterium]
MSPQDVLYWIRRQPFIPFRMYLSTGDEFDVRRPEFIWVGKSRCTVGLFDDFDKDRNVDVALAHIAMIEAVPPSIDLAVLAKGAGENA